MFLRTAATSIIAVTVGQLGAARSRARAFRLFHQWRTAAKITTAATTTGPGRSKIQAAPEIIPSPICAGANMPQNSAFAFHADYRMEIGPACYPATLT
jgi:hypothetical protein